MCDKVRCGVRVQAETRTPHRFALGRRVPDATSVQLTSRGSASIEKLPTPAGHSQERVRQGIHAVVSLWACGGVATKVRSLP
jgi:hypothetical protein